MEKSVKAAEDYKTRAMREIAEATSNLNRGFLESAVSTAYYACFYAIHSQLAKQGVMAKSHKQVGIEFRKQYIKTGLMDKKFSKILTLLSQWRERVDYIPLPEVDPQKAKELLAMAEEFVDTLLNLPKS